MISPGSSVPQYQVKRETVMTRSSIADQPIW